MDKYTLLNLMNSLSEAEAFEIFFNKLEGLRKEKPEQFINTIITYLKGANERDFNYLFHRLKLSEEENNLFFDTWLAVLTKKDILELRKLLISRFQKELFHLAETGEIGTTVFHELESAKRREILEKTKLTDEEISIISRIFDKEPIHDEPLFPSIQWKFSVWTTAGFISVSDKKPLKDLIKPIIFVIANNAEKYSSDEYAQSFGQLIKSVIDRKILSPSKLQALILNKQPAGRPKAYLDAETGKIKGSIKDTTRRIIEPYNDGKSIENILSSAYPEASKGIRKKSALKKIDRILRNNKHLLAKPYDKK